MEDRLEIILERYNHLSEELLKEEIYTDFNKMKTLSKEKTSLEETIEKYKEYKQAKEDLETAKEMLKETTDEDTINFANEEITELTKKIEDLTEKLTIMLLPKDPNDGKNVIVEIRGAAGGDEANIFAGDLYRMYTKYAEKENWKIEIINESHSDNGGFTIVEFMLKGDNVYSKLKYESGSHRVQRVPVTESQGRIHTSTATVLVMPEAEEVDVEIKESDIKIDVFRSSGAGGQSVNTTDSAVRITHLPSKIVVTCQNERSQIQNKEHALQVLKSKLLLLEEEKQARELNSIKGGQQNIEFGSQIRSYVMHPYSMVKDHRTNVETSNVSKVLDGDIDMFIEASLKGEK